MAGKVARAVAGVTLGGGLLALVAYVVMGPCILPKTWRLGPLCWLSDEVLAWQISVHTRPLVESIQNGCVVKRVQVTGGDERAKWADVRPRPTDPAFDDVNADRQGNALYLADGAKRRVVRYDIHTLFQRRTPPAPPIVADVSPELLSVVEGSGGPLGLLDATGRGGVFAWTHGAPSPRTGARAEHAIVLQSLSTDGRAVIRIPVDETPAVAALAAFTEPRGALFLVRDRGPEAPRLSVLRQQSTNDATVMCRRGLPAIAARFVTPQRIVLVVDGADASGDDQVHLGVLLWDWSTDAVTGMGQLTLPSLCPEPPPQISPDATRIAYWTLEGFRNRGDPSVQDLPQPPGVCHPASSPPS
jgi:hypothetical protein